MKKIKYLFLGLLISTSLFLSAQVTVVDSIYSGGLWRSYRLYIPTAYNGTSARPLVLNLHGYTSNALNQQLYSNFMGIADTANFLMVYPQGTLYSGQPYWNAGISGTGVNDIQFLSELVDSISAHYNIDANCVYSTGMSNGGYMSHTLACSLNNKIAAIASVTGSMFTTQYLTCNPTRAVPVIQISGNADATVPYSGSISSLHIDTLVKYWAVNNQCNLTPQFANVPNVNLTDGCTAEHYVYANGTNGASVELYKIIGGGHTWPGSPFVAGVTNQDFKASEKIWLFFRKYKLNQLTNVTDAVKNVASFEVYPNPVSEILSIQMNEPIDSKTAFLSIFDVTGKSIIQEKIGSQIIKVDLSNYSAGIYFVQIMNDGMQLTKKIIVN